MKKAIIDYFQRHGLVLGIAWICLASWLIALTIHAMTKMS